MCLQMAHDEHSMSVQPLDRGQVAFGCLRHRWRKPGFSLQERLSVLSRYRYVAGTTFLLVLIIAAFQIYTAIPMYRATIQLRIQDERTTRVVGIEADDSSYWTDPEPYYQTQYLISRGTRIGTRWPAKPTRPAGDSASRAGERCGIARRRIASAEPVCRGQVDWDVAYRFSAFRQGCAGRAFGAG